VTITPEQHAKLQAQARAGYASTWDELAKRLGVTRRAIQEWRKDPRYAPHCPEARADGRHDVSAWAKFMVTHELKPAKTFVTPDEDPEEDTGADVIQPPRIAGSQANWQIAVLREKFEKERISRLTLEGTLLVASELEVPLGATFAAIQIKLSQFPQRVARHVKGLRDESEIETVLRDEIDADLTDLQAARYLHLTVAEILQDLEFDGESQRLFTLVTFDGQDRDALLELIARVALETLRRIGRRVIDRSIKESKSSEDEIADPITGQVTPEAESISNRVRAAASVLSAAADSSFGDAGTPLAGAATGTEAATPTRPNKVSVAKRRVKKRKSRPKPASPPGEVEASIHARPPRKSTRRRKA
jgi:DNA-binding XRE family transcriptional regulator